MIIAESDKADTDTTSTTETPLDITAGKIELRHLKYFMQLPPSIDSLNAEVDMMVLEQGHVSMSTREIEAHSLNVRGVNADYIYTPETVTEPSQDNENTSPDSLMWTVKADKVSLTGNKARYAINNATPQPGFDMNYIEARDIIIDVDSLYNRGASIRVPLRKLDATERCGLNINATGIFEIADGVMSAQQMQINTNASEIQLDAKWGLLHLKKCSRQPDIGRYQVAVRAIGYKYGFPFGQRYTVTTSCRYRTYYRITGIRLNVKNKSQRCNCETDTTASTQGQRQCIGP